MSIKFKTFAMQFDEGERAYLPNGGENVTIKSYTIYSRGQGSYNVVYKCVGDSGKEYEAFPFDLLNT